MRDTLKSQSLPLASRIFLSPYFLLLLLRGNAKFYLVPKRPLVTIAVGLEDTQSGRNSFEIQKVMLAAETRRKEKRYHGIYGNSQTFRFFFFYWHRTIYYIRMTVFVCERVMILY
jgi:hypothetical protein